LLYGLPWLGVSLAIPDNVWSGSEASSIPASSSYSNDYYCVDGNRLNSEPILHERTTSCASEHV